MDNISGQVLSISLIASRCLLHGAYIILFSICTYILLTRKEASYKYHLSANVTLFLLSSAYLVLGTVSDVYTLCYIWDPGLMTIDSPESIRLSLDIIRTLCSVITDTILLWRCYCVWGRRWKIVVVPAMLSVGTHATAFIPTTVELSSYARSALLLSITPGVVAANNLLLSTLIAVRILSIGRQVSHFVGAKSRNMYRTAIAATLESGIFYSAFLITTAIIRGDLYRRVLSTPPYEQIFPEVLAVGLLFSSWPFISGLATSIIIVRVTLGIALNDVETEVMSVRAAETLRGQALFDSVEAGRSMTEGFTQP